MKKLSAIALAVLTAALCLIGAAKPDSWKDKFDTSLPDLKSGKWEETMNVDFTKIKNMDQLEKAGWAPVPHYKRNYEYWCDEMILFSENGLIVKSEQQTDHNCPVCGVKEGVFTGGIETRKNGDDSKMLFEQAFGYYEATVIVPRGTGMWSAFWLQSSHTGTVGHKGRDGSEIDVYESSFGLEHPTKGGAAIHYDAYDPPFYRCKGTVYDAGKNLYDGKEHTYALKWTPEEYVIYLDGEPVWATDYGDVSRTAEYLRLTVEIRDQGWGPYGEKIGQFKNHDDGTNDFVIKNVKVCQNSDYVSEIKAKDSFKNMKSTYMGLIIAAGVLGAAILIAAAALLIKYIIKKKKDA